MSIAAGGITANPDMKALKAANEYCVKFGKHMVPKSPAESGVYGWSPRQDNLVFMCRNANDPTYLHPASASTS